MAIYAIGDVQGCHTELRLLVDKLRFDPSADQLWFTGDLVNRGPHSLETLRFVKSLSDRAITVLGNHDLHLLAVAHGLFPPKSKDTFGGILAASDRDELIDWLRHRPLSYRFGAFYLIHAGLPPQWSIENADREAQAVEAELRGSDPAAFFARMYGDQPDLWSEHLSGWERLRFATNCLTRMRYCDRWGRLNFTEKGSPGSQPAGLCPWFKAPDRRSLDTTVVFGHWSTLGLHQTDNVICLDTGCLWGGQLTAMNLTDDRQVVSVESAQGRRAGWVAAPPTAL